ncbi:SGNH/GDSL hydrolase family protein [Kaistia dalseonensis]|uniref:SGNH hydrolase-type esterase domain-containing protein n=1 Tax=Kaistia dalseonensis TaxID=410840 RepID=A0ABU0H2P9_9HYPH|nr:SGNH/GDSL hydrolase family protein [Kaistia dalseonensis]MCX5493768.1 SGNH/GDSL hydrolase family protein [Kaistia dalseonensis]MDQ0436332.1 hypothetical protein [Kaistia dalseonensis]
MPISRRAVLRSLAAGVPLAAALPASPLLAATLQNATQPSADTTFGADHASAARIASGSVRARINTRSSAVNKNRAMTFRTAHKTNVPLSGISLEYWNGLVLNTGPSTYSGQSPERSCEATRLRASILTGITGTDSKQPQTTLTQVTWHRMGADPAFRSAGGEIGEDGSWISVPPGAIIRSDPIKGVSLAAGERFFVQTEDYRAEGTLRPLTFRSRPDLGDAVIFQTTPFNAVFEADWSYFPSVASVLLSPSFIWGKTTDRRPVFMVDGDSIISEAVDDGDADGALCFAKRALNAAGFSYFDLSVSGTNMRYVLDYDAFAIRARWIRRADVILTDSGNNDLGSIGFGAAGQPGSLLGLITAHTAYLRTHAAAHAKIIRTTYPPRTDSTDGWLTPASQTPRTPDDRWPDGARYAWRDYVLRRGVYAGQAPSPETGDYFFDLYGALGAMSGLWPPPFATSETATTPDGTHPAEQAHAMAALALSKAIAKFPAIEGDGLMRAQK